MPQTVSTLYDIDGIEARAVCLLQAVDVLRLDELARADPAKLYLSLYNSNKSLDLYKQLPAIEVVEEWVETARDLTGLEISPHEARSSLPDPSPQLEATVRAEPIADASNAQWLLFFERAQEPIIVQKPDPNAKKTQTRRDQGNVAIESEAPERSANASLPAPRLPKTGKMPPSLSSDGDGAEAVSPAADATKTKNAGDAAGNSPAVGARPVAGLVAQKRDDLPRSTRRGLLVVHPGTVVTGALIALITRLLVWAMVIGTPIILIFFEQYLLYFAAVPVLLLIFAVLYAFYAPRVRCRVCGAPLLISQDCRKHEKAHHLFGLGWIGSLCLHALLFAWFRCQYCGSAMRLR